jgi:succinate-semialdehyde dehydrogenase/glutarate-semialdehyde dehydrogenase
MADSAREKQVLDDVPTGLFVDGRWREAAGGGSFTVRDPATGDALCEVADGGGEDAMAALDAACDAQAGWAATPPRERGEILRRAWELLQERTADLALLMTLEMGKPLDQSRAEVAYAAEFFRWFAEQAVRIDGRWSTNPSGDGRLLTMKQPVGPCLLITPWNFPLAMGTRKVGPAVAAGCTMVLKPAQLTPLSSLALAAVLADAGLPPGVLNVVTGASARTISEPLLADPRLRKLSFTGSTPVGRALMAGASENLLRVSMELGGNAPFLVFDDADIDHAVDQAVIAKMRNMGESCVAANRFHVHEPVADEFTSRLAEKLAAMRVGRGTETGVEVGPLIDDDQRHKVSDLVDDAVRRGAQAVTGGSAVDGPGSFYEPTVLAGVDESAQMYREEIFGPVAPVYRFATEDEALRQANGTDYGLVAYVFTNDLRRALRFAERVEAGMVGLNRGMVSNPAAPFGGVKHSGFGREGGAEGIGEYVATKYVAVDL